MVLTSYGKARRLAERAARTLDPAPDVLELDVTDPDHWGGAHRRPRDRWPRLDGALHAVARAPPSCLGKGMLGVPWDDVALTLRISTFSLASLAELAVALSGDGRGCSIVGLDLDNRQAWPNYDWMGVAKSGLESTSRYLARDLGPPGDPGEPRRRRPAPQHGGPVDPGVRHHAPPAGSSRRPSAGTRIDPRPSGGPASPCGRTCCPPPPARSSMSTAAAMPWALRPSPAGPTPRRRRERAGAAAWAPRCLLAAASCGGGDSGDAGSEPAAAQETAAWRHAGYDLGNSRAAAGETAIGPDTAADLSPRWELADVLGVSGTPVVVDGILYVGDWTGHVRALDAGDGTEVWDHAFGDQPVPGAMALDGERVFAASASGELRASIAPAATSSGRSGSTRTPAPWSTGRPSTSTGVVVGVASDQELTGEPPTFRGSVVAYDAVSGDEVWRYRTSDAAAGEGPGVGVWSSPAVDEEAGRLYIGTANNTAPPAPPRSDSVIALDAGTGEQVWGVQLTAGDVATTGDVGATPNLLTVGGVRPWAGRQERRVPRARPSQRRRSCVAELTEGSLLGGVTGSAAVADDTIFVASNRGGTTADLFALGMDDGRAAVAGAGGGAVSGSVSWANGVVYVSDSSGRVHGFDARSGDEVWSHELPATAAGGISVVDGMVYAGAGWWFGSETPDMAGGLVAFGL